MAEEVRCNVCSAAVIRSSCLCNETDLWQTSVRLLNKILTSMC